MWRHRTPDNSDSVRTRRTAGSGATEDRQAAADSAAAAWEGVETAATCSRRSGTWCGSRRCVGRPPRTRRAPGSIRPASDATCLSRTRGRAATGATGAHPASAAARSVAAATAATCSLLSDTWCGYRPALRHVDRPPRTQRAPGSTRLASGTTCLSRTPGTAGWGVTEARPAAAGWELAVPAAAGWVATCIPGTGRRCASRPCRCLGLAPCIPQVRRSRARQRSSSGWRRRTPGTSGSVRASSTRAPAARGPAGGVGRAGVALGAQWRKASPTRL